VDSVRRTSLQDSGGTETSEITPNPQASFDMQRLLAVDDGAKNSEQQRNRSNQDSQFITSPKAAVDDFASSTTSVRIIPG